jgi:gliding motility-associated-like protein
VQLAEHPDAITGAILDITLPECNGDDNGAILVAGLQGGVLPLQYQLDGGALQSSPLFDELNAGTFLLTVTDAENCVFDTTIVIEPTVNFSVDVGPDLEIYLGETIGLTGMTDLVAGDIAFDQWSSYGNLLCTDCPNQDVSPLETTTYVYQLTSVTGCTRADELIVYVLEKGKYFLPNIFSPNGDGINDEVRLHASPGIESVLQWIIFDRWGNAVYGKTDFEPADASVFWNGQTTTGEYVNPGVFPYVLEIQLISGKIEVYHGDITVVR